MVGCPPDGPAPGMTGERLRSARVARFMARTGCELGGTGRRFCKPGGSGRLGADLGSQRTRSVRFADAGTGYARFDPGSARPMPRTGRNGGYLIGARG